MNTPPCRAGPFPAQPKDTQLLVVRAALHQRPINWHRIAEAINAEF
jgi:hypothetical protein